MCASTGDMIAKREDGQVNFLRRNCVGNVEGGGRAD